MTMQMGTKKLEGRETNGTTKERTCPHFLVQKAGEIFRSGLPFIDKSMRSGSELERAGAIFLGSGDTEKAQNSFLMAAERFGNLAEYVRIESPQSAVAYFSRSAFDAVRGGEISLAAIQYAKGAATLIDVGNPTEALLRVGHIFKNAGEELGKAALMMVLRETNGLLDIELHSSLLLLVSGNTEINPEQERVLFGTLEKNLIGLMAHDLNEANEVRSVFIGRLKSMAYSKLGIDEPLSQ